MRTAQRLGRRPELNAQPSRSQGSRWFMIMSLLAMVVMLSLVGLQAHKPLRSGTPATEATSSSSSTTTTSNDAGTGNQSTFDGSAVGNN